MVIIRFTFKRVNFIRTRKYPIQKQNYYIVKRYKTRVYVRIYLNNLSRDFKYL